MNKSREHVISLVNSGQIAMDDLSSRRLSKSQVIIETRSGRSVDLLTLPTFFEDEPLLHTLLHGFTLSWYANQLSLSAKQTYNRSVNKFIEFIGQNTELYTRDIHNQLPPHCFVDWLNYLSESEYYLSAYRWISSVLTIFTKSLECIYGRTSKWPDFLKKYWFLLKKCIPKSPVNEKMPPLGMYLGIPDERFSNRELLLGLRHGTIWLLQVFSRHRAMFLESSVIQDRLASLENSDLKMFRMKLSGFNEIQSASKNCKIDREFLRPFASSTMSLIQSSPLLTEWQFYSFPKIALHWRKSDRQVSDSQSRDMQILLISRCFNEDGAARSRTLRKNRHDIQWDALRPICGPPGGSVPQPCYWNANFICHTPLERLLMIWLLASERAQRSGIEKLTLSDIQISQNERTIQIVTSKNRRSRKGVSGWVGSAIYMRNDPPYGVYRTWLDTTKRAMQFFHNYNLAEKYLPNSHSEMTTALSIGGTVRSSHFLPLELLATPGTVWQKTFLEQSIKTFSREAEAFIAILESRFPSHYLKTQHRLYLPISTIGQSLVIAHEVESNNSVNADLCSDVMGHTVETGKNAYKDRFREIKVADLVKPVQAFARRVGNEKFQLAQETARLMLEKSSKVTLAELQKICGFQTPLMEQAELLGKLDEADMLTIAGEIKQGDVTLIVENEVTATLMAAYMLHLENSLPKLIPTSRTNFGIRHLARLIYLHQIFETLPVHLQFEGRRAAKNLNVYFPPLS
jgi:hypothetical protein